MEKRWFRLLSAGIIIVMLLAMTLVTAFSVSAFEPLDGDESNGSKTTMGPLDSREEGVSQTISYPEDYYSAVTYAPLDGDESEEESDVPTDPSQSVTDPSQSETSASESSQPSETQPSETQQSETQQSESQPSESQPSETQPSESQPSETQSSGIPTLPTRPSVIPTESSQTGGETGGEPTTTMPTMPSQSESGVTDPSQSEKTPLYGDANEDNAVNMKDVLLMRKYVAEIPVTICFVNADVNVDASINMKDVLSVRKYVAELIDHLGPDA